MDLFDTPRNSHNPDDNADDSTSDKAAPIDFSAFMNEEEREQAQARANAARVNASAQLPDTFVSEADLANMKLERNVMFPGETNEQMSRRLMRENLPAVTLGLIKTALYEPNATTRLKAGQYVMDRVLGRVGDDVFDGAKSPLEMLMEDITIMLGASS